MTTIVPSGRSSLRRMPRWLREDVHKAMVDGATIDEIHAGIQAGGHPCSRSAVGRYVKRLRDQMRQDQEADQAIQAWARELGQHPETRAAESAIEIMRALVGSALFDLSGEGGPATTRELARLALVVWRIERAGRLRLKQERMAARAAAVIAEALRREGLSPETVEIIRKAIEGAPRRALRRGASDAAPAHEARAIPDNPA